jgi:Rrf2 family protein
LLALNENKLITSDYIAGSVNTNPVVIRRILANLRRAGLVTSQPGVGGGWQIAQSPDLISLLDVHCSVEQEPLFSLHSQQPNPDCPVGRNIQQALSNLFGEAEEAMKQVLAQTTIGEVLHSIQFRAGSTAET